MCAYSIVCVTLSAAVVGGRFHIQYGVPLSVKSSDRKKTELGAFQGQETTKESTQQLTRLPSFITFTAR